MADELTAPAAPTSPYALDPRAIRPASLPRAQIQRAERLAAALALIAGFVDAYGMITYGVYVSFMSGNTTQTGYQAAEGAFGPASLSALAILFFVVGSFAATLLGQFSGTARAAPGLWRGRGRAGGGCRHDEFGSVRRRRCRVDKFRDGIMNNALSRVGAQAVSVAFVTGALSRLGVKSRARAEARAASGLGGAVGHPSAPGGAARPPLACVSCRRVIIGRGNAALRRLGSGCSGAHSRGAGGVRSRRTAEPRAEHFGAHAAIQMAISAASLARTCRAVSAGTAAPTGRIGRA